MIQSNRSEKRTAKILRAINYRQLDLTAVMENIHDPHNVSAIIRTCDSVGINEVFLIYNYEKFPKIGKKSSASAYKWVTKNHFRTVDECYAELKKNNFKIYATSLENEPKSYWDVDFTDKVAIVLGNEHRGVSAEACEKADATIQIPMYGMIQSLNVSVATAVILYEVARQRQQKGQYDKHKFPENDYNNIINEWLKK